MNEERKYKRTFHKTGTNLLLSREKMQCIQHYSFWSLTLKYTLHEWKSKYCRSDHWQCERPAFTTSMLKSVNRFHHVVNQSSQFTPFSNSRQWKWRCCHLLFALHTNLWTVTRNIFLSSESSNSFLFPFSKSNNNVIIMTKNSVIANTWIPSEIWQKAVFAKQLSLFFDSPW